MFHALWRLIRRCPHAAVVIAGFGLSAAVLILDLCITARQNRLRELHIQPTSMDATIRYILEIQVGPAQVYNPVLGGSFSLGVGIALLGFYLMARPRIVARLRMAKRPPDAP